MQAIAHTRHQYMQLKMPGGYAPDRRLSAPATGCARQLLSQQLEPGWSGHSTADHTVAAGHSSYVCKIHRCVVQQLQDTAPGMPSPISSRSCRSSSSRPTSQSCKRALCRYMTICTAIHDTSNATTDGSALHIPKADPRGGGSTAVADAYPPSQQMTGQRIAVTGHGTAMTCG